MIRNYVAFLSPAVFLAPSEQLPNSLPPWLISSATNQSFSTKLAKHHACSQPSKLKWTPYLRRTHLIFHLVVDGLTTTTCCIYAHV